MKHFTVILIMTLAALNVNAQEDCYTVIPELNDTIPCKEDSMYQVHKVEITRCKNKWYSFVYHLQGRINPKHTITDTLYIYDKKD